MFGGCFDISHWNGSIRWSEVPDTYRLVFIKATTGAAGHDPAFRANLEGAEDTDRMVVPYHWIDDSPADRQCANILSADLGKLVMLDWEPQPPDNHMPDAHIVEQMVTSLTKSNGRKPIMYHPLWRLDSKIINACPWNCPKYGKEPDLKVKWAFWQDTPRGVVPGIASRVDHDWWNGTETELATFYTTGRLPKVLSTARPPEV